MSSARRAEEADVSADEVRVEVDTAGICGSDLHEYATGPIFIPEGNPHGLSKEIAPTTMGHETRAIR